MQKLLFFFNFRWNLLREASLIIVDEVAMAPSTIFAILDKLLRRIYDAPHDWQPMFAGKVVLFGGDMRQLGPIANDGQTMGQLHFRNSPAFEEAQLKTLDENMRTNADEKDFALFLRDVGEGRMQRYTKIPKGCVLIDKEMVIEDRRLQTLIEWTFGSDPSESGASSAILTPFNKDCFKINDMIVKTMPGDYFRALSEDSIVDDTSTNRLLAQGTRAELLQRVVQEVDPDTARRLVHQDELHMIIETGMPPHVLELKKGVIVNLIKNLDVKSGLVNGCRLRVEEVNRDRLKAEIISDFPNLKERSVILPRVRFLKDCGHSIMMQRIQFPVRVGFACTINKSQGLTLDKVNEHSFPT